MPRTCYCLLLLLVSLPCAYAQKDTDGDGLLDVLDVPGFNASETDVSLEGLGIEDLDGVNKLTNAEYLDLGHNSIERIESGDFVTLNNLRNLRLFDNRITTINRNAFAGLPNLQTLSVANNPITSIETAAFDGLPELQSLYLWGSHLTSIERGLYTGLSSLSKLWLDGQRIESIESGAFHGLSSLTSLYLTDHALTELDFTGANFERLARCSIREFDGICLSVEEISSLVLDDAVFSGEAFDSIIGDDIKMNVLSLTDASLVGLTFSDSNPTNLRKLLEVESLDNVWVDQGIFDLYADEINFFDAMDGNTVTVVPLGDCNKDGSLTASDISCVFTTRSRDAVLDTLNSLPGDMDGNGEVEFADYLTLSHNFGTNLPRYADGNIDLEGGIDFADYLILSENFGASQAPVTVPEPNGFIVVFFGVICTTRCRRSRRGDHA